MCQLLGVSARLPGNATRKLCVGDDYYLRFSGLALDEMLTDGEQRELETIGDVKLVVNPRQVMLHRLLTEREPLRHFLVAVAGGAPSCSALRTSSRSMLAVRRIVRVTSGTLLSVRSTSRPGIARSSLVLGPRATPTLRRARPDRAPIRWRARRRSIAHARLMALCIAVRSGRGSLSCEWREPAARHRSGHRPERTSRRRSPVRFGQGGRGKSSSPPPTSIGSANGISIGL